MIESKQKLTLLVLSLLGLGGVAFADSISESVLAKSLDNSESTLKVLKIDNSSAADLVLIDGGLRNGIRAGLLCSAINPDEQIGQVMIVEANLTKSVALVLGDFNLVEGSLVRFNLAK